MARSAAYVQDALSVGCSNEVKEWAGQAATPPAHVEFVAIAICRDKRGGSVHGVLRGGCL